MNNLEIFVEHTSELYDYESKDTNYFDYSDTVFETKGFLNNTVHNFYVTLDHNNYELQYSFLSLLKDTKVTGEYFTPK